MRRQKHLPVKRYHKLHLYLSEQIRMNTAQRRTVRLAVRWCRHTSYPVCERGRAQEISVRHSDLLPCRHMLPIPSQSLGSPRSRRTGTWLAVRSRSTECSGVWYCRSNAGDYFLGCGRVEFHHLMFDVRMQMGH